MKNLKSILSQQKKCLATKCYKLHKIKKETSKKEDHGQNFSLKKKKHQNQDLTRICKNQTLNPVQVVAFG